MAFSKFCHESIVLYMSHTCLIDFIVIQDSHDLCQTSSDFVRTIRNHNKNYSETPARQGSFFKRKICTCDLGEILSIQLSIS
jgi:hypothetical protein